MKHLNRLVLASLLAVSVSGSVNADEAQVESNCSADVVVTEQGLVPAPAELSSEDKSYTCHSAWHHVWQWRWNPRDGWHRHRHCGC